MSKHASVSFADALRLEMDKWGISVHTIEPTLYRFVVILTILVYDTRGVLSLTKVVIQSLYMYTVQL